MAPKCPRFEFEVRGLQLAMRPAGGLLCFVLTLSLSQDNRALSFLPTTVTPAQAQAQFLKLPLSFEANQGQAPAEIQFLARGQGYSLLLTPNEAVLSFRNPTHTPPSPSKSEGTGLEAPRPRQGGEEQGEGAIIRMKLLGANPSPRTSGVEPLPGIVNYFIGNDPEKWRTNIPTYGKVQYDGVYPGIDLVYYGTNLRQLEYDFVVAPGADPRQIALSFEGTERIELAENGDLVLTLPDPSPVTDHSSHAEHSALRAQRSSLTLKKPIVYQVIDGHRRDLAGSYVLSDASDQPSDDLSRLSRTTEASRSSRPSRSSRHASHVGFHVDAYDPAYPLIIDPLLSFYTVTYSTYLGGAGDDTAYDLAVDASGNVYVTGSTTSTTGLAIAGGYDTSQNGGTDVFVVKLNSAGTSLIYATYLGGSGNDRGLGIAVGSGGGVSVTGMAGPGFPGAAFFSAPNPYAGGNSDAFVVRLGSTGATLTLASYYGGTGDDVGLDLVLTSTGEEVITGWSTSPGFVFAAFPPTPVQSPHGQRDAFVMRTAPPYPYVSGLTFLGGPGDDAGLALGLDPANSIYVTGWTTGGLSTFGALGTAAVQATYRGGSTDAFVMKLDTGFNVSYSTYLGGRERDEGRGIAVNPGGEAFVTGVSYSADFPRAPSGNCGFICARVYRGNGDAFVTALDATGSQVLHSTFWGGSGTDAGNDMVLTTTEYSGQVHYVAIVTGGTNSRDFITGGEPLFRRLRDNPGQTSGGDAFLLFIQEGISFYHSTLIGGGSFDEGHAVAQDSVGHVYVAGATRSNDFSVVNPVDSSMSGLSDAFVFKFGGGGGSADCGTGASAAVGVSQTYADPIIWTGPTNLTYNVRASNGGPSTAANVTVYDWLPQDTTFVSSSPPSGVSCTYTPADYLLTCPLGSLAPGTNKEVTVTVNLPAYRRSLRNEVSLSTTTCDRSLADNHHTAGTNVFLSTASTQTYTLTVNKQGSGAVSSLNIPGINCGADCSETFKAGTTVVLYPFVQPNGQGLVHKGWSGTGCGGIVKMDATRTCTAIFGPVDSGGKKVGESFVPALEAALPNFSFNERALFGASYGMPHLGSCRTCQGEDPVGTAGVMVFWDSSAPLPTSPNWVGEFYSSLPHPFTGVADASLQVPFTVTFSTEAPFSIEGTSTFTIQPGQTLGDNAPPNNAVQIGFTPTQSGAVTKKIGMHWVASCSGCDFQTELDFTMVASSSADSTTGSTGTATGLGTADPVKYKLSAAKSGDGTVSSEGDLTACGTDCLSVQPGIACGSDCDETYDAGTSVTLYALEGAETVYDHWEGCDTVDNTVAGCTVMMTGAKTVTAFFATAIPVAITASDPTATEAGPTNGEFTVTRAGTAGDLTVGYTVSGTATNGADYQFLPGTIRIPANQSSATITVTPLHDTLGENDETVIVTLTTGWSGYKLGEPSTTTATVTITSDDPPSVSIAGTFNVNENGPTVNAFTVTRAGPKNADLPIHYTITGTATPGTLNPPQGDYGSLPGTVTIPANQTSATIPVTPINDTDVETTETVIVTLDTTLPGYSLGSPAQATVSIFSDEKPVVTIAATDNTATEAGPTTGTFTVSFTSPPPGGFASPVTVTYTRSGTATNNDLQSLGTSVTIPAGQTSAPITVTPINDSTVEVDETVILTLQSSSSYTVGSPASATVTITSDDFPVATIEARDDTAREQNQNTGSFRVTLTPAPVSAVAVAYTVGGSATSGSDYQALGASVTIPAGSSFEDITLTPVDDSTNEPNESVVVTLQSGIGYTVGSPGAATVTIEDNDPPTVTITATDPIAAEAGLDPGQFTVTRTGSTTTDLTVNFTVAGTATANSDYNGLGTSRTIPAGQASASITVTPLQDTATDPDETVQVTLASDAAYTLGVPASATVTIVDNEGTSTTVRLSPATATATEGGAAATLYVVRSGPTTAPLTVPISASPSNGATVADYTLPPPGGSVTIPTGQAIEPLVVTAVDDAEIEPNEAVTVTLLPGPGYSVSLPGVSMVTLVSNDLPSVTIAATDANAAEAGLDPGQFTISRTGSTAAPLQVSFTVGGTATAGTDYQSLGTGVVIPVGQTSATLTVTPVQDPAIEPDETVVVTLASNAAYVLGTQASATVTLTSDDAIGTLEFSTVNYSVAENGGSATITVTRTGGSTGAVGATVGTSDGSATAGSDYTALTGVTGAVSFANGDVLPKTVTIPIVNDIEFEGDQTVNLTLGSFTGGATAGSPITATLTIVDNDYLLTVTKAGNGTGTVSSAPGGISCASGCPSANAGFNAGGGVALTASPSTGSNFDGWTGDPDCSDGSVTMTAAKTCTATFTLQTFALTVNKTGTGTVSCSGPGVATNCSGLIPYGTAVTLTAAPQPGSMLYDWGGACNSTPAVSQTCNLTMNAAKSVTATFRAMPTKRLPPARTPPPIRQ